MLIHLYAMVRNEAPILPYFFRHYNQFVDKYFMYEDCSDDGSRDIIEAEPKAEILIPTKTGLDDNAFSVMHSNEYRARSRGVADWVFCVDVDEFIYHADIVKELEGIKQLPYKILSCDGWQMMSPEFPTTQGQIYHEVNKGVHDNRYTKSVVFSPEIDVAFTAGRHEAITTGERMNSPLKLLHFRYLADWYITKKHQHNNSRITPEARACGYGGHTWPDYRGEYDLTWYKHTLQEAKPCLV